MLFLHVSFVNPSDSPAADMSNFAAKFGPSNGQEVVPRESPLNQRWFSTGWVKCQFGYNSIPKPEFFGAFGGFPYSTTI